ncbi:hypothetical protein AB0H57_24535 [Micromonospora sp. NPDC050686]|uniref:hypothetical protein n=1 Tax=Micromonospora sp. NPDC050686 TaxID=3154631 RepID=UPI0033E74A89
MARIQVELRVEMEDGTTYDVVADQRDVARWEIQDFGCPFSDIDSRPMLALRWLAWSVLTRRGEITMTWPEFDAVCLEAGDPGDGDGQGGEVTIGVDAEDPGTPAPSGRTSSRSRGAQGSR